MAKSLNDYLTENPDLTYYAMAKHTDDLIDIMLDEDLSRDQIIQESQKIIQPLMQQIERYNPNQLPEVDNDIKIALHNIRALINDWNAFNRGDIKEVDFISSVKNLQDVIIDSISDKGIKQLYSRDELGEINQLVVQDREQTLKEMTQQKDATTQAKIKPEKLQKLIALTKELITVRHEKVKAQAATVKAECKEMIDGVEESLDSHSEQYLKSKKQIKDLRAELRENLEIVTEEHQDLQDKLTIEELTHKIKLDDARRKIIGAKYDIMLFKNDKDVVSYLNMKSQREKLEQMLETETDVASIELIKKEIEQRKASEDSLSMLPSVMYYKETIENLEQAKEQVKTEKEQIKGIKEQKKQEKREFNEMKQKFKAHFYNKKLLLPVKQNTFTKMIGAIRAKLGIGRHKDEKNLADMMSKAVEMMSGYAEKLVGDIQKSATKSKGVSDRTIQVAEQDIITNLENVIADRAEAEGDKSIHDKTKDAHTQEDDLSPSL